MPDYEIAAAGGGPAISPQCGFASGVIGAMTAAQQEAKLRLVGDVARRVWG